MAKQRSRGARGGRPDRPTTARPRARRVEPPPGGPALTLRGTAVAADPSLLAGDGAVTVAVKATLAPPASRDAVTTEGARVAPDDVLEVVFDNGETLWLRGDEYARRFAPAARDVGPAGATYVPATMTFGDASAQSRGVVKWVIRTLKVLGVDLQGKSVEAIGKLVEARKTAVRPGLGLFRCTLAGDRPALAPARPSSDAAAPWLLFLHGTFSSTHGSFGDLWEPARRGELEALRAAYGDRVLAFEHRYLSETPIENARDLAQALHTVLPKGARVHVVSHSRGGLVGELLARTRPDAARPCFSPEEVRLLQDRAAAAAALRDLETLLAKRHFTVERFVRVACPALGTTLASGRLNRWFSVMGTVARALTGGEAADALAATNPLLDAFKDVADFAAAVIKQAARPESFPGLEAMMPQSPLITLVNWPRSLASGDLTVISGDIAPDAWWKKLLLWTTDRFYEGDHDLVVNTPSMYGGCPRRDTAADVVSFHQGAGVNHFTYFRNAGSATALARALTHDPGDTTGFEPRRRPTGEIPRGVIARDAKPRPVAVVLPGIMGSELSRASDKVWIDIPDLVFGGMRKLALSSTNVKATGMLRRYYGDLVEFLARTHRVVPFPFDWRLPIEDEADRLAREIAQEVAAAKAQGQPVRFVAHSMGGLVARVAMTRHAQLWSDICAVPGSRLLMLGTPNGGSHAITELLVGQSSTLAHIALADVTHREAELLALIARFPGVLAMLPRDVREDYFAPETWRTYHDAAGDGWHAPTPGDLGRAAELRALLDDAVCDPKRMVYLAGQADETLARMSLGDERSIEFFTTSRGDGTVTWESGRLPDVPTWYVDAEHADLPATRDAFPAILELLEHGTTTQLPSTPPARRGADVLRLRVRRAPEVYPDEDTLAAIALGGRLPHRQRRVALAEPPVHTRVVHGNLAFASHPVLVGHYAGDGIMSAERAIDGFLDGALARRHQLGLYPGPTGTAAVFLNPNADADPTVHLPGALVVGLGPVGDLTATTLTQGVAAAVVEYALATAQRQPAPSLQPLGLSTLLVGSNAGGLTIADALYAICEGVLSANRKLRRTPGLPAIGTIEVVELRDDRALKALRALDRLSRHPRLQRAIELDETLHVRAGALHGALDDDPPGWWQRLQILGTPDEDCPGDGRLRFSAFTRLARSEVRRLDTQPALLDGFVQQAIATTYDDGAISRTLFEQLLPNEIKDEAPNQDDMVLLVDEAAARFPWELLVDPEDVTGEPHAVKHGLVRQLESFEFRELVRYATRSTALVVGDPKSCLPELPGAQREAEAVQQLLHEKGFEVDPALLRPSAQQVLTALHADAYRVLHLAGHGVYDLTPKTDGTCAMCDEPLRTRRAGAVAPGRPAAERPVDRPLTGMVIGEMLVLSPHELRQLRRLPELVFVNCCHLGAVERRPDANRIAANVATQLIRMGVKAVVAAGWAVDDGAGVTFATAFYRELLDGRPFGEAVTLARRAAFDGHRGVNTWGAYQCYGQPDFRLKPAVATSAVPEKIRTTFEAVAVLENVRAGLVRPSSDERAATVQMLRERQREFTTRGWLGRGDVCAALGRAFGECGDFEAARVLLAQALACADGLARYQDVEQLANFEIRSARDSDAPDAEKAAIIRRAIARLDALPTTRERLALRGGGHKRLVLLTAGAARRDALAAMLADYRRAYDLTVAERGPNAYYPLINWVTAAVGTAWHEGRAAVADAADLRAALAAAAVVADAPRDFWEAVKPIDVALMTALVDGALGTTTMEALAGRYAEVRRKASPREFASVVEHLAFLEVVAAPQKAVATALSALRALVDPASGAEKGPTQGPQRKRRGRRRRR